MSSVHWSLFTAGVPRNVVATRVPIDVANNMQQAIVAY
jgi:hypothetical protein